MQSCTITVNEERWFIECKFSSSLDQIILNQILNQIEQTIVEFNKNTEEWLKVELEDYYPSENWYRWNGPPGFLLKLLDILKQGNIKIILTNPSLVYLNPSDILLLREEILRSGLNNVTSFRVAAALNSFVAGVK